MKIIFLALVFAFLNSADALAQTSNQEVNYETYYPVFKDGKMGYINIIGQLVVNPTLYQNEIYNLNNWKNNYVVVKDKDKSAIYDRNGKQVIQELFDEIAIDEDNKLIKVSNRVGEFSFSSLVGFYNFEGKEIIPIKYETSLFGGYKFYNGLWQFEENNKKGFLNINGEIVITPKFYWCNDFKNNYAVAKLEEDGLYGVINTKGEWVIQPAYTSIGDFDKSGFALAIKPSNKNETIIININGKKVASLKSLRVKSEFLSGNYFDDYGMCRVFDTITKKIGFINQQGKIVIPIEYTDLSGFSEDGFATANKGGELNDAKYFKEIENGNWTLINRQGIQQFVPIAMQKLTTISEGLVSFKKDNLWGFIDSKGNTIIKPLYSIQPGYFKDGLCMIKGDPIKVEDSYFSKTPFGYIDKTGKIIWEIQM